MNPNEDQLDYIANFGNAIIYRNEYGIYLAKVPTEYYLGIIPSNYKWVSAHSLEKVQGKAAKILDQANNESTTERQEKRTKN